jgi:hypothetical protein
LNGVSAIGTKLRFYRAVSGAVTPEDNSCQLDGIDDVASEGQWNYDLLEADGEDKLRTVVEEIYAGCNMSLEVQ